MIASLLNVVGASCKYRDILRESQATEVSKALKTSEMISYRRLNQETSLKRATDAHWGSHYGTILNLINMSSSVVEILNSIVKDDTSSKQRAEAYGLLEVIQSFDFIFSLHLMKGVLEIIDELSKAL